ncbi:MarR family transcriptional regulator [Arthrobacter zhangbolii]|uniref:MarR family transcriptional regulator n=1 Tax=Arthrobacter zhangbolii TaxID=2886936 RepID=A0A9X1SAB8_9MICC|nr:MULTISPECIES: MarR family transcriptional regulator [Arthrobacter]MCC3273371.1 MarR family transcriptional regulator [Arthrobacter zhangbolii]MCC3295993.1 MarR family transcriptional regulator [Arthrobacter zhangbolii]MDN3905652.1 MarR family transcriptional regulator [Arthrobacter sp. YD2]UON92651.1 MarR family transcriptional regulator [Arthrobacter zhangbolii]
MPVQQATAEDLTRKVFALQRALRCVTQLSADSGGPGVASQGVMRMIAEDGELRATELAAKLGIGPAGLSRHVAELEELGYVRRRPHPQDRRAYLISLSELGETVLAQALAHRAAILQQTLSDWTEEQAQTASNSIGALSDTLFSSFRTAGTSRSTPGASDSMPTPQEQTAK